MKILKCVLFLLSILTLIVITCNFITILKSEYEITEHSYYYTLSTIPQVIATLIGLIAIFSIYITEGMRKRLIGGNIKKIINFVYLFLIMILLLGSGIIVYSLYYLPLFWLVENPLKILIYATLGSTALLLLIIVFVLFTHSTEEI